VDKGFTGGRIQDNRPVLMGDKKKSGKENLLFVATNERKREERRKRHRKMAEKGGMETGWHEA